MRDLQVDKYKYCNNENEFENLGSESIFK